MCTSLKSELSVDGRSQTAAWPEYFFYCLKNPIIFRVSSPTVLQRVSVCCFHMDMQVGWVCSFVCLSVVCFHGFTVFTSYFMQTEGSAELDCDGVWSDFFLLCKNV